MGGVPCLRGLRIPVATVVNMVAGGLTAQQIVEELPPLEMEDVAAALRFAADAVADREIPLQPTRVCGFEAQGPKAARTMTTHRTLTDSEIEALADEAEAGNDIDHLVARRNKRGRPTLGAGPASVESVRLDPELEDQLLLRAEQDHTSPSDVVRAALRRDLQPG
jgi:uncharacterized protein (DUF433 family)